MRMREPTPLMKVSRWWNDLGLRGKLFLLGGIVLVIVVVIVIVLLLASGLPSLSLARPTPTPTATATPLPTPTLAPLPMPTSTPIPTPIALPTPAPTPTPVVDAQGDVGSYDAGAPVTDFPGGVDIMMASVATNGRVVLQPTEGVPAALNGFAAPDEALLWVSFYNAVPEAPEAYTEWLFVLDMDGSADTGRPAGSARINPDLGMEVAAGVFYDPGTATYSGYLLLWDLQQGGLVRRDIPMRFTWDESRTVLGIAVAQQALVDGVQETSGVTAALGAVRGRAAALNGTGAARVIDFYPDRPE